MRRRERDDWIFELEANEKKRKMKGICNAKVFSGWKLDKLN
jgi:hypothetical protein